MTVVFDTNVFVSGAVSRIGPSWQCFIMLAHRRFHLAVTGDILIEYEVSAQRLARKPGKHHGVNWRPLYHWLRDEAVCVEPAPLGKQRSRDADDDIFLACALASDAEIIVSHDRDLLALGKPFGVEIMTPSAFVTRLKKG